MYPAPSFAVMRERIQENPTPIIGIIFAEPHKAPAREHLIPRLDYLNARSRDSMHFFCAGYGGYGFADDKEPVGDEKYGDMVIPWGFSQTKYGSFIEEMENATTWKATGDTELILTEPDLQFTNCIKFDVEKMVKDETVLSFSRLLESVMRYARETKSSNPVADLSDRKGVALLGEAAADGILEFIPEPVRYLWRHGKHYCTCDLSRRPRH
jgi:hypothetical protein